MSQVVVTARVDSETAAKLDRIAQAYDRTRSYVLAKALERYVDEECAFLDFIKEGEDSLEREGGIPHEVVVDQFADLIGRRKSAA